MPNTRDQIQKKFPKFLIVGDGGTQKTRFLAGCPKPYVFDFDAGMDSAAEFDCDYDTFKDAPWREGGKKQATSPEFGIYPWGKSWPAFVNKLDDWAWPAILDKSFPYRTLGLDSITTLANQSMNEVLSSDSKTGRTNPQVQHWGQQLRNLETIVEEICAWPIIVVVTAHVRRDDNLVTGEREMLPLVGGQFGGKIGIYFSEVYYTKVTGTGKDRLVTFQTEPQGLYKMAKSRKNVPNGTPATWAAIAPHLKLDTPSLKVG